MKKALCVALVGGLMCVASANAATTVTLGIYDDPAPGGNYYITATLSGDLNQGLACWGVNATCNTAPMPQAAAPAGMSQFVLNQGLTNPAGYGGTISGNSLLQIGGAQNTINNVNPPPYPIGTPDPNVGVPYGTPITVATGSETVGHIVTLWEPFANVILAGEGGPVFAVQGATVVLDPLHTSVPISGGVNFNGNADSVGTVCTLTNLATASIEPRSGRIRDLRFHFDGAPSGAVTLMWDNSCPPSGASFVAYSGASAMTCSALGNDMKCLFAPALENRATYQFDLSAQTGNPPGTTLYVISGLVGDVNSSKNVSGADVSSVNSNWGSANCRADVNESGSVSGADVSTVNSNWGFCAP
jgi:hypothetical protein